MRVPFGRFKAKMRRANRASMPDTITPKYAGVTGDPIPARISTPPRATFGQGEYIRELQDVIEVSIPYDRTIQVGATFRYDGVDWEVATIPVLDSEGIERQFTAETG